MSPDLDAHADPDGSAEVDVLVLGAGFAGLTAARELTQRGLSVRILERTVVLEGQCATYYTKQLAQHAALGVLEDEHLENAIIVTIGQ